MQGYKEVLESLQKMTDVRLNIAILLTCLAAIFFSSPEHFILDPVPKLIPQSLILITSIRLVFSIINTMHTIISKKIEKNKLEAQALIEKENKEREKKELKDKIHSSISELDVFQLYVIKKLIGKNNVSHAKGATLFSLCNLKITYVVATGERSQSVALTIIAKEILEKTFNNDISNLEKNAALRAFGAMAEKEISCFKLLLEKDVIKTTWTGRDGRLNYTPSHHIFRDYSDSIIFEQPQKGFEYTLNPNLRDILDKY
ncbi:hypothetical protein DBP88_22255 [Enterobacter hormaechei]|uniref:hypothetical protein n=1 Tax=Enterobacter hormaechei TaxID=158836 RepID=UPI000D21DC13|nr:hypothetical protein [Enterobacter hormaechei]AVZ15980.1 hypothetical protein DBP88_22255 [Enterobacter hormaechei]QFH37498.1 hypothetical protein FR837_19165 [Enterobacter hormaechei]QFI02076.1 hypothetical protein FR758_19200 [Enterobacter hormaechei]DAF02126.1 MAG TPA: hypothetical protein [Caudoviricetes sp.]